MKLDKKLEGHLATLLEGYEANEKQVSEFITQCNQQLSGATQNLEDTQQKIAELKEVLNLQDEVEESTMETAE